MKLDMKFYEEQIQRLDHLMKSESSGPFLKSNKIFYEIQKERMEEQVDGYQRGWLHVSRGWRCFGFCDQWDSILLSLLPL